MTESEQNRTEWKPTPLQAKVLEVAEDTGFGHTISYIAIQAGVRRATIYDWFKADPEFKKAWEELPKRIARSGMPGVAAALKTKAVAGDVQAIKLIMEYTGEHVSTTKHEHSGGAEPIVVKVVTGVPDANPGS